MAKTLSANGGMLSMKAWRRAANVTTHVISENSITYTLVMAEKIIAKPVGVISRYESISKLDRLRRNQK